MTTGTIWQVARTQARQQRREVLGYEAMKDVSAERLLALALKRCGLRFSMRQPGDTLLSGAHAVLDPEAHTIWVRADATPNDRRLYLAHELAHFYLHERGMLCCCSEEDFIEPESVKRVGYGPRQRRETEANVFAREFLLPTPLARELFRNGLNAHDIARKIGVPETLVFAQLAETLLEPVEDNPEVHEVHKETETPPQPAVPTFALDSSQEIAARTRTGPLLVGAGPGTGKTRTLTQRVLFLTQECGVAPENLLALTFSRKAADEMRERIGQVAPEVASRASISTFHAYGLELLRRHGKAANLPPIPVLLEEADACALLERRIATLGLDALQYLHDPAYPLPDILRRITRVKEEMITPETFAERAEASGDDRLRDVAKVYFVYENLLREKGAMDYSDLICRTLRLLEGNEAVRAAERAQWQHILVDEYQDINRTQARLVQTLAGEGEGLWCVGDTRQAIYAFRGASPANIEQFRLDYPNGDRKNLMMNYRSRPELVALFGIVIGEKATTWVPTRQDTEPGTVTLAIADDEHAQADGIAESIEKFVQDGYLYKDQAVLCRTRAQARQMRAALSERGIPVASGLDEGGFFARRDIKDLVTLLSRACEPSGPARHRFPDLPEGLPYKSDALDFWLELLWGTPGWARHITDTEGVARLLTVARTFRDRASAILEENDEPRRAFLRHLRRMARLGASFGDPDADTGADAVRLLTVHGSKGLEFPVVFVPNLSQNKFPPRPGPSLLPALPDEDNERNTLKEEERLFFVAVTRARDHLILSRAQKYNNQPGWPSPLLRPLNRQPVVQNVVWKRNPGYPLSHASVRGGGTIPVVHPFTASTQRERVQAIPKDSLPEGKSRPPAIASHSLEHAPMRQQKGDDGFRVPDYEWDQSLASDDAPFVISAGQAELYLRCPRRYYYQRVAEVPSGERSPYEAFQRCVETALESLDPTTALEAALIEHGLDDLHPYTPLYRHAASDIIRRSGREKPVTTGDLPCSANTGDSLRDSPTEGNRLYSPTEGGYPQAVGVPDSPSRQKTEENTQYPISRERERPNTSQTTVTQNLTPATPETVSLTLENGRIEVNAATDVATGGFEYPTFRKPPTNGTPDVPPDPRLSLLQEILRRENPQNPAPVFLRFMQNGETHKVPDRFNVRKRHIENYNRALRGIRLKVFPATPADSFDCPNCPYFFLCPDETTFDGRFVRDEPGSR